MSGDLVTQEGVVGQKRRVSNAEMTTFSKISGGIVVEWWWNGGVGDWIPSFHIMQSYEEEVMLDGFSEVLFHSINLNTGKNTTKEIIRAHCKRVASIYSKHRFL
eukprot:scaffold403_cov183-Ochromonas_danica.AAC.6